ncbi:hypothetical protein [Actimicrobium antarcticum]
MQHLPLFIPNTLQRVREDTELQKLAAKMAHHAPGSPPLGEHVERTDFPSVSEASFYTCYSHEVSPATRARHADRNSYDRDDLPRHNDAHMHPWSYIQKGIGLKELVLRMKMINCMTSVVMPIPTSIIPLQGDKAYKHYELMKIPGGLHHCGPRYYLPAEFNHRGVTLTPEILACAVSAATLSLDTEVDDHTADEFKQLEPDEQNVLDPMITGLHLGSTRADFALFKKLARNPGVFTGGGELTFNKELVEHMFERDGQASLHPVPYIARHNGGDTNIEPAKQLMAAFGVAGMPVCLHCDIDDWIPDKDGNPKNLAAFSAFIGDTKVRDTKIIWAHAGGLGRFVKQSKGHLNALEDMLALHPNLVLDIAWSEVARQLTGVDLPINEARLRVSQWTEFLEKHSSRIMFGSDSLAPKSNQHWSQTLIAYKDLLRGLSAEARLNVLEKSYETHIKGARDAVRKFENHVLPFMRDKLCDFSTLRLDIPAIRIFRDALYSRMKSTEVCTTRTFDHHEISQANERLELRQMLGKKILENASKGRRIEELEALLEAQRGGASGSQRGRSSVSTPKKPNSKPWY